MRRHGGDRIGHGRISVGKLLDGRGQEVDEERIHRHHRDVTLAFALQLIEFAAHQVEVVERRLDMLQHALARRVQADAVGQPVEQFGAHLGFELEYLPVDRARRDIQVLRGLADRTAPRHFDEILQDVRMHGDSLSSMTRTGHAATRG